MDHAPTRSLMVLFVLCLPIALSAGCAKKPVVNDPDAKVPLASAPTWQNWSRNLVHKPGTDGKDYYFSPTSRAELKDIVTGAPAGMVMRVSGQRHSQPPLVADENRDARPETANAWLIDLACYADLGADGKQRLVLDAANLTVTVNAGVREDELAAFLTRNNMMLKTVTAGGFFSVGGMTAIDVHGATVKAPIFAETASAFTIMGPTGEVTTIDAQSANVGEYSPLQFARVSLGALGVVTSVTIDVLARPYATSLQAAWTQHSLPTEAEFVSHYKKWLADHDRVESFFDPYTNEFLILHWDVVADPEPQTPNIITEPADACTYAEHHVEGATYEGPLLEPIAEGAGELTQTAGIKAEAELMVSASFGDIKKQLDAAAANYDEMWLTASPRVVFMSYFVELPNLDDEGLAKVWKGLQAIPERVASNDGFLPAGPLEFRFIKGGDSVLAGTWSTNPDATFVNLDLIGFVAEEAASDYPLELLAFFADIERAWVALGGVTHNGKMYGFYDPSKTDGYTAPFNPAFLSWLKAERGARVEAFEAYRKTVDPDGRFCNEYLGALIGCGNPTPAP